jgi:hypothetical protein
MYFNDLTMDINRNNYETFFLLYLDGELGPVDKQAVESFLSENADLQKEFALLQQTIFLPEEMVYEPKELLFRKEEKIRIFPIYWIRIAASIAVLLTAGWFIRTEILSSHKAVITGNTQAAVADIPSTKNPVNTNPENKKQMDHVSSKINGENVVQSNQGVEKKPAEIKNAGKSIIAYKNIYQKGDKNATVKSNSNLTKDNNHDQNPPVVPLSDESRSAALKSSTALEIQPDESTLVNDSKQISALTKTETAALVIVPGANVKSKNENMDLKETYDQTDNAISVIALNENNKSITGFFKKLTKISPDDNKTTSTRKVHISVFQFSY